MLLALHPGRRDIEPLHTLTGRGRRKPGPHSSLVQVFFFFFFLGHDLICLGEEGFSQNAHFIFRYLMNTRCPGFLLSEFIQCGDIDCSDSHLHINKSPHVPFSTVVIKTQQTTCPWVWFSSGKACSLENKSLLNKDPGGRPCSNSCVSPLLSRVGMSNIGAHICAGGEWSLAGR